MKTGFWQLAVPSLLCLSLAGQVHAGAQFQDGQRDANADQRNQQNQVNQAERQQQRQIQQQQQQLRGVEQQQQQQIQQQQYNQQRQIQDQQNQQRQVERQQDRQVQQQQNQLRNAERQQQQQQYQQQQQQRDQQRQFQTQQRQDERQQLQQRQDNLPIQSGPRESWQTQPPRQGNYQDLPREQRPRQNWAGRPDGRGDGWGTGPRYRPGNTLNQVPRGYSRIPWRGQDYYYAEGYWYRPQGERYVVVAPPQGVRVSRLPAYSQELWVGGSLLFLAAGSYYAWQPDSQDYVVVNPPQAQVDSQGAPPSGSEYDPVFSPIAGQTPERVEYDRYQCYRWAADQSGFDPANVTYAPADQVVDVYRRAMGSCLYERGYRVE